MKKIIRILVVLATINNLPAQNWTMTELAPMPEAVSNNAVVEGFLADTAFVFSFGGLDSTKNHAGIHLRAFRYNHKLDIWRRIADLPDTMGKIAAGASRIGDVIYIMGGYHVFANGNEKSSDRVHRYHIPSNSFLADGAAIPIPIDDHVQAVWRDSLIFLVTGWSNNGNRTAVQIYNPATDIWQAGTSTPSSAAYKSFGASGVFVDDTLYYFGGATDQRGFGIQNILRKGVINPANPSSITWSMSILGSSINGYRMAATRVDGDIYWLGGSNITYNYNGIAYNGSGGVPPSRYELLFQASTAAWGLDQSLNLPMDLRGIAVINPAVRMLAGGMESRQKVSKKLLRLELVAGTNSIGEKVNFEQAPRLWYTPDKHRLSIIFSSKNHLPISAAVYDLHGREVRKIILSQTKNDCQLDNFLDGLYFLKINHPMGVFSFKFIVR